MDAPPGTYMAYATAPGNLAEDGSDADGKKTASFSVDKQGLNNLPNVCP